MNKRDKPEYRITRRSFLKNTAAASAGLAVAKLSIGDSAEASARHDQHEKHGRHSSLVAYVDPLIGTQSANTAPAVGVPFGMTHWTPATSPPAKKCISPYYYNDNAIEGIRGSHWPSGSCMQDYGSVTLMPITGELKVNPSERASKFTHKRETSTPTYYSVMLEDYRVQAEVTATARAGFLRFRFPTASKGYVVVDSNAAYQPATTATGEGWIKVIPETQEIVGYNPIYRIYQGSGQSAGFSGYFVVRFNKSFESYGTWNHGEKPQPGSRQAHDRPGAFIQINDKQVCAKVGTSFVSIEGARANLNAEIHGWRFESVMRAGEAAWQKALSTLTVEGGAREQRVSFYTAMYHAMLLPRLFNDVDGAYPKFGKSGEVLHTDGREHYMDFSLWDTFRAVHPLLVLTQPARARDMVQSLVAMSKQGGWLPIFPMWNNYTSEMIGDHSIAVITDAYFKGITNFDIDGAYALMRQNAFKLPAHHDAYVQGKGRRALDSYLKYGYVPLNDSVPDAFHQDEQVSRTLEYAYDDSVLARLAKHLGHNSDYKHLLRRAYWYRNVIDRGAGFARGRWADGSWIKPFDPLKRQPYVTESTPWIYTWFVPQDVVGLAKLLGGTSKAREKLETTFRQASRGNFQSAYYNQGDEQSHHIVYLFDYLRAPWLTQKWVREIMSAKYHASPTGLPGQDDAGQVSAWYVFSAMGLYPVSPGSPFYTLGSPLFERVTLRTRSGSTFTIEAKNNSQSNCYIQSASLNGKAFEQPWITHEQIVRGGVLRLRLGDSPNKSWGSEANATPPALSGNVHY